MRGRLNKLLAIFLTVTITSASLCYAEDITEVSANESSTVEAGEEASETITGDGEEEVSANSAEDNEAVETASAADEEVSVEAVENRISSIFNESDSIVYDTELGLDAAETAAVLSKTADELSALTAGEDYIEDEAYFTCDSEEKAKEVAAEYGAELTYFSNGVATLKFDRNISDVFTEAARLAKSDTLIHPNYCVYLDDYENESDASAEEIRIEPISLASSSKHKLTDPAYNDHRMSELWYLDAINVLDAWDVATDAGDGVNVCVIDSGCKRDHEDLSKNIHSTQYYSVIDNSANVDDTLGHGTHCAGSIAAVSNNEGIRGVAYNAKLSIIKVFESRTTSMAYILAGLSKATGWDIDVLSMSFGAYLTDASTIAQEQNYINTLYNKGVVILAAASNESTGEHTYPASCEHVISVAAAGYGMYKENTIDGVTYSPSYPELASYSNFGTTVDIVSPGGSGDGVTSHMILSTIPDSTRYGYKAGTSMATPICAGVAALVLSTDANKDLIANNTKATADAITDKLLSSTDGKTYTSSYATVNTGCIDALAAVTGKATASTIKLMRKNGGLIRNGGRVYISQGASEKLQITDIEGNKLDKSVTKSATWTLTDGTGFKVKKGKVKVASKTPVGTTATVTVESSSGSATVTFEVISKVKKVAYLKNSSKFATSIKVVKTVNSGFDIGSPSSFIPSGSQLYAIPGKAKKGSSIPPYKFDSIGYSIKANKKTQRMMNGTLFTPTKKGTYTVKYVLNNGSGKAFTIKFKVK